ncbi:hypothetical protein SAY87_021409 [Trapa incisa]|uniref:Pectinesterase n=1 Tax=Trapa incisa TaxID=236973 RepID=A0AAN7PRB5_9MYRT|nr:hypothetical protein SAY87_021406 [Trapa incisa]KAK4752611.1 hypothetical protein SAY87_021409 [Trapa incisa]
MSHDSDSSKKKSTATIAVSTLVLVVIGCAATVGVTKCNQTSTSGDDNHVTTSNKAVQAMCQPTDYKDACVESLQGASSDVNDPKELVKVGFNFTKKKLAEVLEQSATYKEAEQDPMAKQALSICMDMMDLAVDHLEQSFERIGVLDVTKVDDVLADLETWLSSVITYQGTCIDEFENVTSTAVPKIKEALDKTLRFSSNILVMVQQLNTIFKKLDIPEFNHRRLLEEEVLGHGEYPTWMNPKMRKLLANDAKADLVIAQDGSGNFKTFSEAVKALPIKSMTPFVVKIKAGIYKEKVVVPKNVWNITWIGAGAMQTKITNSLNFIDGVKTYYTSTFTVQGAGHIFKNMGFENSAGAAKHQAVAIVIDGDRTAFFNCRFDGYQDTLYSHANRQFYRDCTITGTVDFIFGDSRSLYQNCLILVRKPLVNQQNIVAASGRFNTHSVTGLIFQNCTITGDQSYLPVKAQFKSYLGRPWKEYSKTIYMQSFIDDVIHPDGWLPWFGTWALDTCYYAEFNNRGPGSDTSHRVTWRGIRHISQAQAAEHTGKGFFEKDDWITNAEIPYNGGMMAL